MDGCDVVVVAVVVVELFIPLLGRAGGGGGGTDATEVLPLGSLEGDIVRSPSSVAVPFVIKPLLPILEFTTRALIRREFTRTEPLLDGAAEA